MRTAIFALAFGLAVGLEPLAGQEGGEEWTAFTSMRLINQLVVHNDEIWSATSGGVLRFNQQSAAYTRYTRLDGLAGNNVLAVAAAPGGDLWFGTAGQGLNRFRLDRDAFEPPFREFRDRRIEALLVFGDRVFVGTDQGVSVFLVDRQEVKETYRQLGRLPKDTQVRALAVFDGKLWAGTDEGVAWADLSLPNLQDPDSWGTSQAAELVTDMLVEGEVLLVNSSRGVFSFARDDGSISLDFSNGELTKLGRFEDRVVGATPSGALFVRGGRDDWTPLDGPPINQLTGLSRSSQALWLATDTGLQVLGGEAPPPTREPSDNAFYKMTLVGTDELWVATAERDFGRCLSGFTNLMAAVGRCLARSPRPLGNTYGQSWPPTATASCGPGLGAGR